MEADIENTFPIDAIEEIMRHVRKNPALMETMRSTLSQRGFVRDWAQRNEVVCPKEVVARYIKQWKSKHPVVNREEWLRANGLTQARCLRLLADRASFDWINKQGPEYFGLQESFILDWAAQNGVTLPLEFLGRGATARTLENWVVQKGPDYFGLNWSFEIALLEELQVTGRAAETITRFEAAGCTRVA